MTSIGIIRRKFAAEQMIRTAPNLNHQNAEHEVHSENPNWNRTCIDSNISLNFKFEPNNLATNNRINTKIPSSIEIINFFFAEDRMN